MPTKAAWLRLATNDGDVEFEFFLATKLGMTVSDLRRRMSQSEFLTWSMYYARQAQAQEIESKKAG